MYLRGTTNIKNDIITMKKAANRLTNGTVQLNKLKQFFWKS